MNRQRFEPSTSRILVYRVTSVPIRYIVLHEVGVARWGRADLVGIILTFRISTNMQMSECVAGLVIETARIRLALPATLVPAVGKAHLKQPEIEVMSTSG